MNTADTFSHPASSIPAACPMHALHTGAPQASRLAQGDWLVFPFHKRVITQYLKNEAGADELFLFYGDQEISFDEPELFAFGEALSGQSRFAAGAATGWGSGYAWERVQELLEQLLDAGILERGDSDAAPAKVRVDGERSSPLPPAATTTPRTWLECEAITRELTGHPIELGYLELLIPIFRIAHMHMDAEGRQVGEANVFPKALRLDVPTNWRTCIYPGSRFQDERPMNVSALKSMRAHWPQMMAALLKIRAAYLERFPSARAGWTVGDVERLSTLVLAIPTYVLMKSGKRVENGDLHPVLSSLFRVTDGLRMTTHQMLFVPVAEATLSPIAPITSQEVYAYAERNHAFASTHGVCAGPKVMIEEFLQVLMDGKCTPEIQNVVLDPAVADALAHMEPAFDYGLLGLQAHAVVFSLWPMMTRTYEQIHTIAQNWGGPQTPELETFRAHLKDKISILKNQTLHATEEWRANREHVYADIFAHCSLGLGDVLADTLPERIADATGTEPPQMRRVLRTRIATQLGLDAGQAHRDIETLLDCLLIYFLKAQAIVRISVGVQKSINALLGRANAVRPFTVADIDVHVLLQGNEARRLPHLLDELESLLGFRAVISRDAISVAASPEFADIGLADNRAISTAL